MFPEWIQPIRHVFLLLRAHIVTFSGWPAMARDGGIIQRRHFFVITETQFAIQSQVT